MRGIIKKQEVPVEIPQKDDVEVSQELPVSLPVDNTRRCGLSYLVTFTPPEFKEACGWHDDQYELHHRGEPTLPREEIDKQFYKMMKDAAGSSWKLRFTAWCFYSITEMFGQIVWDAPTIIQTHREAYCSQKPGDRKAVDCILYQQLRDKLGRSRKIGLFYRFVRIVGWGGWNEDF